MPVPHARLRIDLGARSYPVCIGGGLLAELPSLDLPAGRAGALVTNSVVGALYADQVERALAGRHAAWCRIELPDGEAFKTWTSVERVLDGLAGMAADRDTVLYALGGGVIGDITGFAAACYMRGVRFVQIPTTLLAQVDSSVGGKTGVNHAAGKNLIGAFHQPVAVVCDVDTLASLPRRELAAGLAEVIKYAPIADLDLLGWLEDHLDALLAYEPDALAQAVRRSCEIKAQVVGLDEREGGLRAILNFGHTFGHAIESGLGYGQWLHGEAVGCGMVMALHLSHRLGGVDAAFVERVSRLIARAGLPVQGPAMEPTRYLELMRVDKKAQDGAIRFVVLEAPGRAVLRPVRDELVRAAIMDCAPDSLRY